MEQEENNYKCLMIKANTKKVGVNSEFNSEVIGKLVKTHKLSDQTTGLEIITSRPEFQNHVGQELGLTVKLPEKVVIEAAMRSEKQGSIADFRDQNLQNLKRDWQNKTGIFAPNMN